jgi:hypothetical protein
MQSVLMKKVPDAGRFPNNTTPTVIAALGLIEETMEYLNTLGYKSWRPNPLERKRQLEELVDQMFFLLEIIVLSGFTWEEISRGYAEKWHRNMDRYASAEKGDYSWDDRLSKKEL